MVPTRPAELLRRRVLLAREPLAAGQARSQVRAAIRAWAVPVDPDIAILLTSDLVTEAITYWAWPEPDAGHQVLPRCPARRRNRRVRAPAGGRGRAGGHWPRAGAGRRPVDAVGRVPHPGGPGHVLHARVRAPACSGTAIVRAQRDRRRGDGEPYTPSGSPSPLMTDPERTSQLRDNVVTTLGDPHQRPRAGSAWIKSSHSYANGDCVEVTGLPGGQIAVRDSRDPAGAVLAFPPGEWRGFLGRLRNGNPPRPPGG